MRRFTTRRKRRGSRSKKTSVFRQKSSRIGTRSKKASVFRRKSWGGNEPHDEGTDDRQVYYLNDYNNTDIEKGASYFVVPKNNLNNVINQGKTIDELKNLGVKYYGTAKEVTFNSYLFDVNGQKRSIDSYPTLKSVLGKIQGQQLEFLKLQNPSTLTTNDPIKSLPPFY